MIFNRYSACTAMVMRSRLLTPMSASTVYRFFFFQFAHTSVQIREFIFLVKKKFFFFIIIIRLCKSHAYPSSTIVHMTINELDYYRSVATLYRGSATGFPNERIKTTRRVTRFDPCVTLHGLTRETNKVMIF